MSQYFMKKFF